MKNIQFYAARQKSLSSFTKKKYKIILFHSFRVFHSLSSHHMTLSLFLTFWSKYFWCKTNHHFLSSLPIFFVHCHNHLFFFHTCWPLKLCSTFTFCTYNSSVSFFGLCFLWTVWWCSAHQDWFGYIYNMLLHWQYSYLWWSKYYTFKDLEFFNVS